MFHRRRAHSDDSPKNENAPDSVRVTGRPSNSRPPELLKSNLGSVVSTDRSTTRTLGRVARGKKRPHCFGALAIVVFLIFAKS